MAKSAWITPTELTTYVEGLGVTIPAGVSLQDEIDAAVGEFERLLGQSPYLAEGAADDYTYDPPGSRRLLDLGGFFFDIDAVEVGGSALTAGADYWLKPSDRAPYRAIAFASFTYGDPQTVTVTGKKGVTDDIPVDLWNAVRDQAAAAVIEGAVIAGTSLAFLPNEVKQGSVTVKGGGDGKMVTETLRDRAMSVFRKHVPPSCAGL